MPVETQLQVKPLFHEKRVLSPWRLWQLAAYMTKQPRTLVYIPACPLKKVCLAIQSHTVPGRAGIAVLSPRVNAKGNSIRGSIMLEGLSKAMDWHFALP